MTQPDPGSSWTGADRGDAPGGPDGLARTFAVLRRRWLVVLLPVLIGAAAAYLLASNQQEQYQSSTSLLFRAQAGSEAVAVDTTRQAATNVDLVSSDEIAQRTAAELGGGRTLESIREQVSITSRGDSDLVSITARDADPATAALIANTWAAQYIAFRQAADRAQITRTIELIDQRLAGLAPAEREGTEGQALRARRNDLEIQASLQTGNAEVVEEARPNPSPVSPRPRRSAVIAGLLGLILGLGAALVANRLDRRISTRSDLEESLGLPVLGTIPRAKALASGGRGSAQRPASTAVREAFRVLRTNISFFRVNRKLEVLLVTSAVPGEGKTTVAIQLAQAYADLGLSTALVEGDLRRPSLSSRLGVSPPRGLTNILVIDDDVGTAALPIPLGSSTVDLMVSGPLPPNPQEMLESDRMAAVVAELRRRYDVVVVDAPPLLAVADTASLIRHADGVVVVSRLGVLTRDDVIRMRTQMRLLDVRPLGVVINAAGKESSFEYYGAESGASSVAAGSATRR